MSLFKNRFKLTEQRKNASQKKVETIPFDQREKVYPLSMVVTICNRHQDLFFIDKYAELGASLSLTLYAYSNPPEDIVSLLGFVNTKKDILITITRSEYVNSMLEAAENRFLVSSEAKGIAFSLPISGVAGINSYKFLADSLKEVRLEKERKEEAK